MCGPLKVNLSYGEWCLKAFGEEKLKTRMNWLFNMVGSFHVSCLCEGWSEGALEGGV